MCSAAELGTLVHRVWWQLPFAFLGGPTVFL